MQPQIFLSYSWRNKDIADAIDKDWQGVGITMTRDVRDVQYKGNLKDFMKRVHESDFVLLLISKDYLESKNCMYEALEMFEDPNFKRKILPILTDDAKLSDPLARIKYLDYWEDKKQELDEGYRSMRSAAKAASIAQELDHYDKIRKTWDSFADQIQSILCATWPRTQEMGYSDIFNHIGFNKDERTVLEECRRIVELDDPEEQELALEDLKAKHAENFTIAFISSSVAYKAENFKICRRRLERIIATYPPSYQVHFNLGLLLSHELQQYEQAREHLERAVELRPNNARALVNLGVLLSERFQQYDEARVLLERAMEAEPDNPDAYTQLAILLAELQKLYTEARPFYEAALKLAPTNHLALVGLARLAKNTDKPEESRTLYEQVVTLYPDDVEALNGLGILLGDSFQLYEAAQQLFERALAEDPNDYAANMNLAHLFVERFRTPENAIKYLREAIRIEPNNAQTYENLADLLSNELDSYDEAIELYKQALALEPNKGHSLVNLAAVLLEHRQDTEVARSYLAHAVKVCPDDINANYNYALLLDGLGESEEAKHHLERAATLNPDDVVTKLVLGTLLEYKLNLFDQAKEQYEFALAIDQDNADAHHKLGTLLARHFKRYTEACQHFKRALEINPNQPDTLTNFGVTLYQLDDIEAAIPLLERAIELDPTLATANMSLAFALLGDTGDTEKKSKAKEHYLRACQLNPKYKSAEDDEAFGV